MKDAFMIRKDGKVFTVRVHPYIIIEDLLLSLENGEWFYNNTLNTSTKMAYIDFVAWFIKYQLGVTADFKDYLLNKFDTEFYGVTSDFIVNNIDRIVLACETVKSESTALELLKRESDQEFLRVRYGGKFETNYGVKEIYFRVSSTHFNWYNFIWNFVNDNKSVIDFVTIVKDEVALGVDTVYSGKSGLYQHMPVDTFLTEPGNPVVEWQNKAISVVRHLEMGGTIAGILELPINNSQAWKTYLKLVEYEKRYPKFYSPADCAMSEILCSGSVRDVISKYT